MALPIPSPPNPVPPPSGSGPVYFNSPYRIITAGLRHAKLLTDLQDPTSEQLASGMNLLNDIINMLQTRGLKLWLQEDIGITPVQGQNLYTIGPTGNIVQARPPRIIESYYSDNNSVRRPLIPLSRNEWDYLAVLNQQGAPANYFVDKQQQVTNYWIWLTPDQPTSTGTLHVIQQVQVNNMISLTDTMNFPIEWYLLLQWAFAYQKSTGQPQAVITKCKTHYDELLETAEGWDVEDASTFFQPDQRLQYVGNRFK